MTVQFSTRCPNSDYLGFETSPEAIVVAAKKAEEVGFDAILVNDHIIVDSSRSRAAPWTNVYDPTFRRDVVYRRPHDPHRGRRFGADHAVPQPGRDRQELGDDRPDVGRAADRRCRRRLERGRIYRTRRAVPRARRGAPPNICAFGRPAGRRARSRSPAGSFRSPTCISIPKPVQQPHPPIWIGGASDAALRRAAPVHRAVAADPAADSQSCSSVRPHCARRATKSGARRSRRA